MPATILVVDDDPVILQLLQVNFEMEGFVVITAGRRTRRAWTGPRPIGQTSS